MSSRPQPMHLPPGTKCPLSVAIRVICAALVLGIGGCASVQQREALSSEPTTLEMSEELTQRVNMVRRRAWETTLQIVEVYEQVPKETCPGIAAFVSDVRKLQLEVGVGADLALDEINPQSLLAENPNFWRATLEIAPSDGSIILLHAAILASSGEIWRAQRILTAATQNLPMAPGMRPYFLAHQYALGSVVMLAAELSTQHRRVEVSDGGMAMLDARLREWPNNAIALAERIDLRIRLAVAKAGGARQLGRERVVQVIDQALVASTSDIQRLFELDPISGSVFRGSPEERDRARELRAQWAKLASRDSLLTHKEIGQLAALMEKVGEPELAMVLYRLEIVSRGFPSPSDVAALRRVMTALAGAEKTEPLLAAAERGEINVVEMTHPAVAAPDETWKGDPSIHPLLKQQVEREIAELTFRVELLAGDDQARAEALRQRAIQYSRSGQFDLALEDIENATALVGRDLDLLIDRAIVLSAQQRDEEVTEVLSELEASQEGRDRSLREAGIFHYGRGRFENARAALYEHVQKNPEDVYAAIMTELASRRAGRTGAGGLDEAKAGAGSWADYCRRFVSGQLSEDDLLAEAHKGDALDVAQKLCEAYFFLAQTELAKGNRERGVELLEMCIETGITGYVEYRLARLELKRIAPERDRDRERNDTVPGTSQPASPSQEKDAEQELLEDAVPA